MWVIIAGDLYNGVVSVVGPFDNQEHAEEYADTHNMGHYQKAIFKVEPPNE